jgi:thiol-disulfide isomerase/thioredoxin
MNRGRFALETAAFLTVSCTAIARADDPITVPMPTGAPAAAVATPQPTTRPKRTRVPGVDDRLDLVVNRPVDLRLQSLDGPDFALQQYRGSVVVLNVFATWCGPCQKEQRTFTSFAAAHPDDTIVIGITNGEADDAVRRYRQQYGVTYPIAMDRYRAHVRTLFRDQILYPTTIVVRPNGFVSSAWVDICDREWLERERLTALGRPAV